MRLTSPSTRGGRSARAGCGDSLLASSQNHGHDFGLLKVVVVPFLPIRGGVAVTLSQRTEHAQHPGRSPETSLPLGSGFATWTHSPAQAAPWSGAMNADGRFLSKVGMIGGRRKRRGKPVL